MKWRSLGFACLIPLLAGLGWYVWNIDDRQQRYEFVIRRALRGIDSDKEVTRYEAAGVLGLAADRDGRCLDALVRALEDPSALVSGEAARAIRELARLVSGEVERADRVMAREDFSRYSAKLAWLQARTFPVLRKKLNAANPAMREMAAYALIDMDAADQDALKVLRELLRLPETNHTTCARAILTLDPVDFVMYRELAEDDWNWLEDFARSAFQCHPAPSLRAALRSADRREQLFAVRVIGSMFREGWEAVPDLIAVLERLSNRARPANPALPPNPTIEDRIAQEAIHALERMGSDALAAVPVLQAEAKREAGTLIFDATNALANILADKDPPLASAGRKDAPFPFSRIWQSPFLPESPNSHRNLEQLVGTQPRLFLTR